MGKHLYQVHADALSPTKSTVHVGDKSFTIDEPVIAGGTDDGPNPVEYLLGALSGCICITAYTVAKQLQLEIRNFSVDVEGDFDSAYFLGKTKEGRAGYTQIRVMVHAGLLGDDEKKELWWQELLHRCPVDDNLMHETPVSLSLIEE